MDEPVLLPHIDLLHWTNQFFKIKFHIAPQQLITVHDVNFMHNEISDLHKKKKLWVMAKRMAKATHYTFISEFTRTDFGKHFNFNKPSRVIVNGVTNLNTQPQEVYDATLKDMGVEPGYLFHISRWSRKKNVHLIVDMMRHLPGERLVIAGTANEKFGQMLRQRAIEIGHNNITFVGKVSTAQKAALLSRCKGMLFPSRSEGFGLPVVEAMCFGKPSFLTRLTSLPEVGGKEAYYFDSLDLADMAKTSARRTGRLRLRTRRKSRKTAPSRRTVRLGQGRGRIHRFLSRHSRHQALMPQGHNATENKPYLHCKVLASGKIIATGNILSGHIYFFPIS